MEYAEEHKNNVSEESQEETQETKRKKLTEFVRNHPRSVFATRLLVWFLLAFGMPFGFIVWRFDLFQDVSKMNIGGWGILAIAFAAAFLFALVRYLKIAFGTKHSMTGQIFGGFCKVVLPLAVFMLIMYAVRNDVDLMLQVFGVIIVCETVAIPVNPLPKWVFDRQRDVRVEERKETVDYLLTEFFKKKDKEGE